MKKSLFVGSLILLSQATFATEDKSFNVKYGAHGGGFGFGPAVDYRIDSNWTIGLSSEALGLTSGTVTAKSSGLGVNARYYLDGELDGAYVSGYMLTGSAEATDGNTSADLSATTIGATAGRTWLWDSFNLDAGVGVRNIAMGDIQVTNGYDTSVLESAYDGTGLSVTLSAGFAF